MISKKIITTIIGFIICLCLHGQTITTKLILTDTKDSLYINSRDISLDKQGNYCFVIKKDNKSFFVTNEDTIGGFTSIGSGYSKHGRITSTRSYRDSLNTPFYYKNTWGVKVYGTAVGKTESYQTSNTRENIALMTTLNDSVYFYINGNNIAKNHTSEVDPRIYAVNNDWVAFSENGNIIYFFLKDSLYRLFVNEKQIDSSNFKYAQLAINDKGDYIFAKGNRPSPPIKRYDYRFYIHSRDTVLDYVRTVWFFNLKRDGAYYYSGNNNEYDYIAINDKLYKNIEYISDITLIDRQTFLYSFYDQKQKKINVNGTIYKCDFDKLFYPAMDKNGNFACYGIKKYYLYKFVNGKKEKKPLSKYGVRAYPLYISPNGISTHCFKTDDSVYFYQDDQLLFSSVSKVSDFRPLPIEKFLPYSFVYEKVNNGNYLIYLECDSIAYLVFNGKFSKPMPPVKENSSSAITPEEGEFVAGEMNSSGFFIIQKLEQKKYMININNQLYEELDGFDRLLPDAYFFDGKELIFYGIKSRSFYQITLGL